MLFELVSENLTHLGGPMGTEETWNNWSKFFTTIEAAKEFAEKDYQKESHKKEERITWTKNKTEFCSGDLSFVMYTIRPVKVEA